MTDVEADLREAFEAAGFTVAGVSVNRDTVRVSLLEDDAGGEALRDITAEAVGDADSVRRFDVSTEAIDGRDQLGTVVSFRYPR
jgi:hypothetical protein